MDSAEEIKIIFLREGVWGRDDSFAAPRCRRGRIFGFSSVCEHVSQVWYPKGLDFRSIFDSILRSILDRFEDPFRGAFFVFLGVQE